MKTPLTDLIETIDHLNPDCLSMGAGMMAKIKADGESAREWLAQNPPPPCFRPWNTQPKPKPAAEFQLTPEPETTLEAFRRIAAEHGYTIGADGKITDSGFHPEAWPDGQPKQFVGPAKSESLTYYILQKEEEGIPQEPVLLHCTPDDATKEFISAAEAWGIWRESDEGDDEFECRATIDTTDQSVVFERFGDKNLRMWRAGIHRAPLSHESIES